MGNRILRKTLTAMLAIPVLTIAMPAQSPQPYPNAITDTLIHGETPMAPPATNVVFTDPDFGSQMVRATDENTNFKIPGTFLRSEASGEANEWSVDSTKFYVLGKGGQVLAFAFDPTTMAISSLPNASTGQGLLIPLRPGPTFSFVDPDLIYGHTSQTSLTITSYRFSTGASTAVIDTTTCGVQPPLGSGRSVLSDDDVSVSLDDSRVAISEGGPQSGKDMFVVVYNKNLGCRWYNTQTAQIGGQWGPSGSASLPDSYLVRHAYLARSGNYVRILTDTKAWYVWDLTTLTVSSCVRGSGDDCNGYGVAGYNSLVNGPAVHDDMQVVKRPLSDLTQITSLVYPLPSPANWGQEQRFTWSNVDVNDSTPVCGSTYGYEGEIEQTYAQEIFCIETDGVASTIWRFAHNRADYIDPYFQTQPLGNVSTDGRFFIFSSDWDAQLGTGSDGTPRSDVFIVKLD